jgi:mRNA-degrading endonuclease RelE of RelBE toxin-antitoxin system
MINPITTERILNGFNPLMEGTQTYTLLVPNSFHKQLRKLTPKDRNKIMLIMDKLEPYILHKNKIPPESDLRIYDWHQLVDNPNTWDFHSGAYTVVFKYDDINLQVRAVEVASYGNSSVHKANSR